MTAPDVAGDYRERDVQAVYRVLIELGQVLGAWRDKFVVVGGAVPWLLLPEANPSHIGTLDIDLALDPLSLEDEEYARLLETLEHSGYERNIDGLKPFQLRRWVRLDAGAPIAVLVDFLVPRGSKFESNDPTLVPGFRVISADGAGIAITHSTRQHLDGKMVDGRENSVDLLVATIPAFLVMKGYAIVGRDKKKDAYDIYFAIRNFPGGPEVLWAECTELLRDSIALTGFNHIAKKFRSASDFGPTTVRRFLEDSSGLGEMTADQVQTDAYMQVSSLLDRLSKHRNPDQTCG